jgi:hypothetical protein
MFICYLISVFVMFIAGTTDATGAAATGQGVPIAGGVRFGLSQAANLDNSWTFEGHENEHDPQVNTRAPLASRRSFDAERTGFEQVPKTPTITQFSNQAARNAAHFLTKHSLLIPFLASSSPSGRSWRPVCAKHSFNRPHSHLPEAPRRASVRD